MTESTDDAYGQLAATLWHERECLEDLLYALTCQRWVLESGSVRWLARADDSVQDAVAPLADAELRRAMATDELLQHVGLSSDLGLETIAARADEPWNGLLADHRDALRDLVAELGLATAGNRRLLQAGAAAVRAVDGK